MSNGFSRSKGARGEREAKRILGKDFKRTGYAGVSNPDLTSDFAIVSVKCSSVPISLKKCLQELITLEAQDRQKEHYVMVKVEHQWVIIQKASQFRDVRC